MLLLLLLLRRWPFDSVLFYSTLSFCCSFIRSMLAGVGWLVGLKMERKERKSQSVILCPTGACRVIQFGAQPPVSKHSLVCNMMFQVSLFQQHFTCVDSTHSLPEWHVHVFWEVCWLESRGGMREVTPLLMSKEHMLPCNTMSQVSSFHQHLTRFSGFLILIRYLQAAYLLNFLSPINCQNDMCMWFGVKLSIKIWTGERLL